MDTITRRSQWRGRGGFSPHFPILRNRKRLLAPESKKICSFRLVLRCDSTESILTDNCRLVKKKRNWVMALIAERLKGRIPFTSALFLVYNYGIIPKFVAF